MANSDEGSLVESSPLLKLTPEENVNSITEKTSDQIVEDLSNSALPEVSLRKRAQNTDTTYLEETKATVDPMYNQSTDGPTGQDKEYELLDRAANSIDLENTSSKEELLDKDKIPPTDLKKDMWNIILLIILYLLQGVPNGLASGSIPFLLKEKLSYAQIATFSLVTYPYSIKLLWSPIVDSSYFPQFGRRKTWIVPVQTVSAILLLWLGNNIDGFLNKTSDGGFIDVASLTYLFTALVALSATQDIAVDGWALTLLSEENLSYASTCQTIGLTTGYFLSFTIFLALNSAEFCNSYLRAIPQDIGIVTLSSYLTFWGIAYAAVTFYLIAFKTETPEKDHEEMSITETYQTIMEILKLPHTQTLVALLLIYKIGFICNDAVTSLKLIELGFKKEDLAVIALIDFPFQIIFGYYAAKWSADSSRPLKPWLYAIYGRLFFSFIATFVVMAFPADKIVGPGYFLLVITVGVLTSFTSTVQFVGMSAFFNRIADPYIGGTYMTFLNTLSNLGGTWPKYFILEAVEYFTKAECSVDNPKTGGVFSCVEESAKNYCLKDLGGTCTITRDGFYWVNTFSVALALIFFTLVVRRVIPKLEVTHPSTWKIKKIT